MSPKLKIISRAERVQSFFQAKPEKAENDSDRISSSKNLKIMVTAIGGRAAYNLVRCLKESGIGEKLIFVGADMSPDNPRLLCDEFVTIPSPKSDDFIPAMQKIVRELNIDLVIPTSDEECLALAKNRAHLENIKTIPIGGFDGVMSSKDKLELYNATKHLDIVPMTFGIQKGASIAEIKKLVGLPAFIKPRMGRGGRHTHSVMNDSAEEQKKLDAYWNSFEDDFGAPICQPLIESSDYGIDAYINSRGEIHFGAARKKLKVNAGNKIVGMRSVSIRAPDMEEICKKIIEIFGLKGIIEIEMRKDASGKIYVLDVNPRVGGSIYISKASGRNIAMLPVLDYLHEQYPAFEYADGIEMIRREITDGSKKYLWDFVASAQNPNPNEMSICEAELPEVI